MGRVVIDAARGLAIQIWTVHDVNSALVASSARVVNVDIQAPRTVRDGLVVAFRAGLGWHSRAIGGTEAWALLRVGRSECERSVPTYYSPLFQTTRLPTTPNTTRRPQRIIMFTARRSARTPSDDVNTDPYALWNPLLSQSTQDLGAVEDEPEYECRIW